MTALNLSGLRQMPLILQAEKAECGMACLAMVLGWFGHHLSLTELRNAGYVSTRGSSLKNLIACADRHGLRSRALRLECGELARLKFPLVLHWNLDHFVVLAGRRRDKWLIHDPASGKRWVSAQEFSRSFTGVALELAPDLRFERRKKTRRLAIRDLWTGSTGLGSSLLQLFLLSLLLQGFALGVPLFSQLFIDDVLVNADYALLKILVMAFLTITLVKQFTEWLRAWAVLYLGSAINFQIGAGVFRHLLHLPLDYFSRRHMGDIVSRFGSITRIRDFLGSGLIEVIIDGLMVTGTLVVMFIYSTMLTWVALAAVFLYVALRVLVQDEYRQRSEEAIHAGAGENSLFMENIRAMQGIKLFGRELDRLGGWQSTFAGVINAGARLQRLVMAMRFCNGLLSGVENIILMGLGGYAVLNQQMSMGMLIAYLSFKDQFLSRVFALIDKVFEFRLLKLHLERLSDIVHTPTENCPQGNDMIIVKSDQAGNFSLDGVGFRYGREAPWLFRQVHLDIGQGECVAIVGPTGCGKSTLLRIVLSLVQPTEGTVNASGCPQQSVGLRAWREQVTGVLQDDCLLAGSILQNITFFDPRPDRQRAMHAAEQACIATDIQAMPMRYDTLTGSMGTALSGGQIQRLLLARAFYRQPRLLVLDEATSHLDLVTEREVNAAVSKMKVARLIVAHRPQTILQADRILRLTPAGLVPVRHAEFGARPPVASPVMPEPAGRIDSIPGANLGQSSS